MKYKKIVQNVVCCNIYLACTALTKMSTEVDNSLWTIQQITSTVLTPNIRIYQLLTIFILNFNKVHFTTCKNCSLSSKQCIPFLAKECAQYWLTA